jgi:hypothetical protein
VDGASGAPPPEASATVSYAQGFLSDQPADRPSAGATREHERLADLGGEPLDELGGAEFLPPRGERRVWRYDDGRRAKHAAHAERAAGELRVAIDLHRRVRNSDRGCQLADLIATVDPRPGMACEGAALLDNATNPGSLNHRGAEDTRAGHGALGKDRPVLRDEKPQLLKALVLAASNSTPSTVRRCVMAMS